MHFYPRAGAAQHSVSTSFSFFNEKRICESCGLRLSDPHFFGHGGQTFVLSLWKNIARPGTEALYKSRSDTREGFAHFGASVKGKRSHTGPAVAEF